MLSKKLLNALTLGLLLMTNLSVAHENEQTVVMELVKVEVIKTEKTIISFQLFDTIKKMYIDDKSLKISHENLLHTFVYDSALREFQHVHPTFKDSAWSVEVNFKVSGKFWFWAQGVQLSNDEEFSSSERLDVSLNTPAWPVENLKEVRAGSDGVSVVSLSSQVVRANRMVMLDVLFSRNNNSAPQIGKYLGAIAHVVATTEDGDSLIHVHPMETTDPNKAMLHATFKVKGLYRLWIQFLDGKELRVVPLAIDVK
jgi:hypothetical protein